MSRTGAAVIALEIAAGAAVQGSGFGGIYATGAAIAIVIATAGYLFTQQHPLSERLRAFAAERRASAPPPADEVGRDEHALDTIECFSRRYGPAVKAQTQRLVSRGIIGVREQQRLNTPADLGAIERLADRLAELECHLAR